MNGSAAGLGLCHSNHIIEINGAAGSGGFDRSRAFADVNGSAAGIELHVGSRADHQGPAFRRGNHLAARRADLDGSAAGFHMDIPTHLANSNVTAAAGGKDRSLDLVHLDSTPL